MLRSEGFNDGVAREALAGLQRGRKTLPAKLLYDDEGCRLFEKITRLKEYYLTRTETELLSDISPMLRISDPVAVVEYGASDETKAEILLNSLDVRAYVPIDVAGHALAALKQRMTSTRRDLFTFPIEADFLTSFDLPVDVKHLIKLGFFPGSTIGNLDLDMAVTFLSQVKRSLGVGSFFLVGVDLRKPAEILLPAYNDSEGVTAAFNLNLLARLNREADADFNLAAFEHEAVWDDEVGRVEMHLKSRLAQSVSVAGQTIQFADGETIHTENSYKHTLEGFETLARSAGWAPVQVWTDAQMLFSVHLLAAEA